MAITAIQQTQVISKPQEASRKPESQQSQADKPLASMGTDQVTLQSKGSVSPIITISGGAFAGSLVGAATGGLLMGAGDLFLGGAQSVKQATAFGGGFGAVAGFISGGVVANLTDSKLKATLFGAISGAGIGAVAGGAMAKNLPAALISGGVGAVSGGVSAFMTSKWLGH
ncbi:hypothetical protein COW36_05520 [bacterium (Candidatus Blackallbacteria) CG17_big_fil_post_rev_8_21_14_2_50_48_46]|uniref:Uncharacterized protein n=1 Tax=bacterium (Candidatus Blackallbacteria) CG17_big_fil_post_rev_8_21_14_2_50_48_46 TaxID=2014261 RepID=A0A2M7G812_9BACT|nr:MAG: hypothetical protein COW64_21115 [bacterium (Candidatus Blackallbacteria) CG18_big_fil_WC_8_21_14_2_50_49_26]PIW18227.1 MAG: hypothetical protein COW36_05520 [bacterium (Candidatus Blackallbacteria) CG17_big_fil_post_rev_8_21_14_2_50_48_46]PIW50658.1 MAG: hypothetical protein COW20_01785 [bacterium (Candidatus Blackallbacteria) CG13_big_fil_rev_8_21_14_2_50_49_14]